MPMEGRWAKVLAGLTLPTTTQVRTYQADGDKGSGSKESREQTHACADHPLQPPVLREAGRQGWEGRGEEGRRADRCSHSSA